MATVLVTSAGLNLHRTYGKTKIIDKLAHGNELTVIETRVGNKSQPDWLKVKVVRTGQIGWVDSTYTAPKLEPKPHVGMPRPVRPYEEPIKLPVQAKWPKWVFGIIGAVGTGILIFLLLR